jgi:hypothetical protein
MNFSWRQATQTLDLEKSHAARVDISESARLEHEVPIGG